MLSSLAINADSLFLYTEEKRGKQLVESSVIGMVYDYSGSNKMIVVKDPFTGVDFLYRIHHDSGNLDAVSILYLNPADFNGKTNFPLAGKTYKLGKTKDAMSLLGGRAQWIQDKGSILAVLLQGAARRSGGFLLEQRIARDRLKEIPADAPVVFQDREPAWPSAEP